MPIDLEGIQSIKAELRYVLELEPGEKGPIGDGSRF